jgi:hypothetical protein
MVPCEEHAGGTGIGNIYPSGFRINCRFWIFSGIIFIPSLVFKTQSMGIIFGFLDSFVGFSGSN